MTAIPDFDSAPGRAWPGVAWPGSPGIPAPAAGVSVPVVGYARAGTGLIPALVIGPAGGTGVLTGALPGLSRPGLAAPGDPGRSTAGGGGQTVTFGAVRAGTWP